MIRVNLQNPAAISAFAMSEALLRQEESRAYFKNFYAENRDRRKAQVIENDRFHRAEKRIYAKKWREENETYVRAFDRDREPKIWAPTPAEKEARRAYVRADYAAHPQKYIVRVANRRARKLAAPGICTAAQLKARFEFYGNRCAYCGAPAEAGDHVIPLSRGGSNWPANIRPACKKCEE